MVVMAIISYPLLQANPPSSLGSASSWNNTFTDNFNTKDTSIWKDYYQASEGTRWKDAYNVPGNAKVQNGTMRLITKWNPNGDNFAPKNGESSTGRYECGFIRTRHNPGEPDFSSASSPDHFNQKYGYFEARMKLSDAPGQWGAFWLMSRKQNLIDNSGNDGCEIDIVEAFGTDSQRGKSIHTALHWDGYGPDKNGINKRIDSSVLSTLTDTKNTWHEYGLYWSPKCYIWYVDDVEVFRIQQGTNYVTNDGTTLNGSKLILQFEPAYLKLSSEVVLGQNWNGTMNNNKLPATTYVDWVKVWTRPSITTEPIPGSSGNPPPSGSTFTGKIEAEAMDLTSCHIPNYTNASGGKIIRVNSSGGNTLGKAKKVYGGNSGNKRFTLRAVDGSGSYQIKLYRNSTLLKKFNMTTNDNQLKTVTHDAYLSNGDTVEVRIFSNEKLDYLKVDNL